MNKFNKSPSEQLIIALLSFLNEKKASYQKISVLKTYTIKWHYYSFIKIICIKLMYYKKLANRYLSTV